MVVPLLAPKYFELFSFAIFFNYVRNYRSNPFKATMLTITLPVQLPYLLTSSD
jgi:hypothetical protein